MNVWAGSENLSKQKHSYEWINPTDPTMQALLERLANPIARPAATHTNQAAPDTRSSQIFSTRTGQPSKLRAHFGQSVISGLAAVGRGLRRLITPRRVFLAVSLAAAVALTQQVKPFEKIKDVLPAKDAAAAALAPTFPGLSGSEAFALSSPSTPSAAARQRHATIEKRFTTPNFMVEALHRASIKSDFNFLYLFHLSRIESTHTPYAAAPGTSAFGPFQFTDDTWVQTFKTHGDKYGFGNYTAQIGRDGSGEYTFPTPAMRVYVMTTLRQDPELSGEMAAELARDNRRHLEENYGGKLTLTELYTAHFLGSTKAVSFLKARDQTPDRIAAEMFPNEAQKNPDIFYDFGKNGGGRTGRTFKEVARELMRRMPSFPIDERVAEKQLASANLPGPRPY